MNARNIALSSCVINVLRCRNENIISSVSNIDVLWWVQERIRSQRKNTPS